MKKCKSCGREFQWLQTEGIPQIGDYCGECIARKIEKIEKALLELADAVDGIIEKDEIGLEFLHPLKDKVSSLISLKKEVKREEIMSNNLQELYKEMNIAVKNMRKYGGDWARILADLIEKSDPHNLVRIRNCFADVIEEYLAFGEQSSGSGGTGRRAPER